MNDLKTTTITTLEVAEMMGTEHYKILRKLEGDKNRKGYIEILADAQMGVSDYFMPATYKDASGKENKCYEVTKLGCDFLANKFTGEKGVIFTAKYVKRFDEMEHHIKHYAIDSAILKGVARAGCLLERIMKAQGSQPYQVAIVIDSLFKQSGIYLPECFIKKPEFVQYSLFSNED